MTRIKKIRSGRYKGWYEVPSVVAGRKYFKKKRVYLKSHAKDMLEFRLKLRKVRRRK